MIRKELFRPHFFLFWLSILTAFSGTLFLTFSIGQIHLFPFRLTILSFWIFLFMKNGKIDISFLKVKKSFIFICFWFFFALLSIVWSASKIEAIKQVIFLFLSFSLMFFMVLSMKTIKDFKFFIILWLSVFTILIPVGIWETLTGNHLPTSGLQYVDEGMDFYKYAPTGIFANQNDYATFLSFSAPIILSLIQYESGLKKRLFLSGLFFAGILMLLLTTSRANYLGVFISTFFSLLFFTSFKNKIKYTFSAIILLGMVYYNLNEQSLAYLNFVWEDLSVLSAGFEDTGLDVRGNLIKNAFYYTFASFGMGVGAGNIEYYISNFPIYDTGSIANVHNWWLEILANYGVIILLLYIVFYISLFVSLWKIRKKSDSKDVKLIAEALICILIAFPISSTSSSSLIAFNPHWLIFGFMLAFVNYNKNLKFKM